MVHDSGSITEAPDGHDETSFLLISTANAIRLAESASDVSLGNVTPRDLVDGDGDETAR